MPVRNQQRGSSKYTHAAESRHRMPKDTVTCLLFVVENAPNCLTMAGSLRHNARACVAGGRWQVARIGATISNVMMFTCYANTINSALWAIFVLQIEMPTDMLTQLHHVDCQGGNPFMCVWWQTMPKILFTAKCVQHACTDKGDRMWRN